MKPITVHRKRHIKPEKAYQEGVWPQTVYSARWPEKAHQIKKKAYQIAVLCDSANSARIFCKPKTTPRDSARQPPSTQNACIFMQKLCGIEENVNPSQL